RLEGTLAAVLELFSVTCMPEGGAGAVSVTVFVATASPPTTLVAPNVTLDRAGGETVNVAVTVVPLELAEMTAGVATPPPTLSTVKVAEAAPAGTGTEAPAIAAAVAGPGGMTAPPRGALPSGPRRAVGRAP